MIVEQGWCASCHYLPAYISVHWDLSVIKPCICASVHMLYIIWMGRLLLQVREHSWSIAWAAFSTSFSMGLHHGDCDHNQRPCCIRVCVDRCIGVSHSYKVLNLWVFVSKEMWSHQKFNVCHMCSNCATGNSINLVLFSVLKISLTNRCIHILMTRLPCLK